MTKKDYEKIAETFRCFRPSDKTLENNWYTYIEKMCEMFKRDNSRFDAGRFIAACLK